jgi:uncharacterized protein YbjT (DUF2867 family)
LHFIPSCGPNWIDQSPALPHVAKADVAAVATHLLLTFDWQGIQDVLLHSPEYLSFNQIAETLTAVLGRPVAFSEMSMTAFGGMLSSVGTSAGMVRAYVHMMTAKNAGMDSMHPDASRRDTPTTFRNWAESELRPVILG